MSPQCHHPEPLQTGSVHIERETEYLDLVGAAWGEVDARLQAGRQRAWDARKCSQQAGEDGDAAQWLHLAIEARQETAAAEGLLHHLNEIAAAPGRIAAGGLRGHEAHKWLQQYVLNVLRSGRWEVWGTREGNPEPEKVSADWLWNPVSTKFGWDTTISFAGVVYHGVVVRRAVPAAEPVLLERQLGRSRELRGRVMADIRRDLDSGYYVLKQPHPTKAPCLYARGATAPEAWKALERRYDAKSGTLRNAIADIARSSS